MRNVVIFWALCAVLCSGTVFCAGLPLTEKHDEFMLGSFDATVLNRDGISLPPNLVTNGNFENGFEGWNQNASVLGPGYNGGSGSKVSAGGSGNPAGARTASIAVENNSSVKYSLGAWLKCTVNTGNYYFRLILLDSGGGQISHMDLKWFGASSDWTYFFTTIGGAGSGAAIILPANCAKVCIDQAWWNPGSNPSGDGWMDEIFLVKGVFTGSGAFNSRIYDCGQKTTFGKISWTAETTSGCSVVFNTRSGTTPADVLVEDWSDTYYSSSVEIDNAPGRYFQYRAILSSADISVTPLVKEISVGSPVKAILAKPSFLVKAGDRIHFEYYFDVAVDTGFKPEVSIVSGSGNVLSIPGPSGTWLGSVFTTGETLITGFLGDGFADIKVEKGMTVLGDELFCYNPSVLFIDSLGFMPADKSGFFPDPFSPNKDGKCDAAKMEFLVEPAAKVTLKIYSLKGVLVRALAENRDCFGNVQFDWDGTDISGRAVPVGLYIYQLRIDYAVPVVKTGTVTLVK